MRITLRSRALPLKQALCMALGVKKSKIVARAEGKAGNQPLVCSGVVLK